MTSEYDRGWQAAMRYVNERHRVEREAKMRGGAAPLMFAVGLYVVAFTVTWIYALAALGEWHPWLFMLSLGGAVWMVYLRRSWKRDVAVVRKMRAELEERWK